MLKTIRLPIHFVIALVLALHVAAPYSRAFPDSGHHQVIGSADEKLKKIFDQFIPEFKALNILEFDYSYLENFRTIQNLDGIARQTSFFEKYRTDLLAVSKTDLSKNLGYQYDALFYEIDFNLERLALERRYRETYADFPIPSDGLFNLPDSKRWYALYIRRWTSTFLDPEEIFEFGMSEVNRILLEYRKIQRDLGYEGHDEAFYEHLNGADSVITDWSCPQLNGQFIVRHDSLSVLQRRPILQA